jgi:predicted nucleic acid-binding protein
MSFLLNRDTSIAWLRHNRLVQARCLQHQNDVRVAAPTIMELARWLLRPRVSIRHQLVYWTLMQHVPVVSLDRNLAERAALVALNSSKTGFRLAPIDWMVIATALEAGLTLVTHDIQRYAHILGLTLVDWMTP